MKIFKDFSIAKILWYKIGGKVQFLLEAENKEDLIRAFDFIDKNHISRIQVVGLGSNLLFTDSYFEGAVVRIVDDKNPDIRILKDGQTEVFSGTILGDLINFSFNNGLIGLEWAGGLPGTVGAGIRGNVGAFGGEIKNVFSSCGVFSIDKNSLNFETIDKDEMDFSYRNSKIKQNKNLLVVSSIFELNQSGAKEIQAAKEKYALNIEYRKKYHPVFYPTCGSVFKNIINEEKVKKVLSVFPDIEEKVKNDWHGKISMAYIIKRLGFSGFKLGGAQVSDQHANFIINLGGAKFIDVLKIMELIKENFSGKFGFVPEKEVEIVE